MKLIRNNFDEDFIGGRLTSEFIEPTLVTLERPWIATSVHNGGKNDISSIPNGTYKLVPFARPSKDNIIVPQLMNKELGVYLFEDEMPPEGGRFLILMHPGNIVDDIVGCICSGSWKREPHEVNSSRDAQAYILQAFHAGDTELIIESFYTKEIYVMGAD